MFPTDNDIHRLISMKDADSGFFVLAVYSFIEAHMKSQMKECGLTVANDHTFQTISGEYQRLFQRRFGRLSPKEQAFFSEMKRRKQDTNRVRHEFAALSVEEARCAAGNLLLFYTIVDEEVKGKLRPLETFLGEWGSRNPPADSAKELLEANQRIQELGMQLQELMEQSQEYQQFKVEFQRLEKRCQLAELEWRDSEEKAASYHRQLEEYRQLQEESQTKFGQYEDYICRLQRMVTYTRTRNEFERALLRLTAEQEEAVSRITFKKDYLVKGSAGTGKSLVLLKTIEKLLSQSSGTCVPLFVTFTKSLVKYNAYVASLMEMGLSEKSIRTADSFFVSIMEHIFPGQGIDYKIDLKDKYAKPLRNFLRETYPQQELDVNDVFREATTFIWPNLVPREEYIDQMIDRTGLLTPLRQELRQVYWAAITWLEQQLDREKLWWHDYAKLRVARALRERPLAEEKKLADYVFVDESQDLSVCSLYCIKAVCRKSLVLAGDRNQSIYRLPFSMARAGIDVRGNSITLKTNFRNTVQINQVAERYRSLIPGMNQAACPSSFRLGPPVELLEVDTSRQNVYSLIAQRAQLCVQELGYEPGNVCVIVNSNQTKQMQSIQQELRKCGLAYGELKDMDFSQGDRVCISTIQACKGLDFPVVILLADHRSHIHTGSYSPEQVDRLERNMFYVAMTRAMDMLTIVTTSKAGNPVVTDIKACVQAERAQGNGLV